MTCARIAEQMKGRDIVVREVAGILRIADYFVIVTGGSRRQLRAIAEEIDRRVRAEGEKGGRIEGLASEWWTLLDFDTVVVHLFSAEARAHYDLELLWADAPVLEWEKAGARSASAS
ncbi:MAG: ribosome silencing factor [Planctomycetes bacterium]|nr:ribosome silencing factor [Planctomycetota bacterium]